MFSRLRRHLSYANVTATIALFLALGGVSYAAVSIPRNSVGSAQLKKNAVTSSKVKDRSLLRADFKRGQLPRGAVGARGATGAQGPQGRQGQQGVSGSSGISNYQVVTGAYANVAPGTQAGENVACPNQTKALGGGVFDSGGVDSAVSDSIPAGDNSGWSSYVNNGGKTTDEYQVYAICATVSP